MSTPALSGHFLYQSFRDEPITVNNGQVVGTPALARPWAPVGTLDVKTDRITGDVVGTLTFRPGVALNVRGTVSPASAPLPASVELKAEGVGAVYALTGWFLPDDDHLVGSVVGSGRATSRRPACGNRGAIHPLSNALNGRAPGKSRPGASVSSGPSKAVLDRSRHPCRLWAARQQDIGAAQLPVPKPCSTTVRRFSLFGPQIHQGKASRGSSDTGRYTPPIGPRTESAVGKY